MLRISFVGHSNVPENFVVPGATQVELFRKRGGHILNFFDDSTLSKVLDYTHELCYLFLGSNDIVEGCSTTEIVDAIIHVTRTIEARCRAKVVVLLVENRVYYGADPPICNENYKKAQQSINTQLRRAFKQTNRCIHLTGVLAKHMSDGVHFTQTGHSILRDFLLREVDALVQARQAAGYH